MVIIPFGKVIEAHMGVASFFEIVDFVREEVYWEVAPEINCVVGNFEETVSFRVDYF